VALGLKARELGVHPVDKDQVRGDAHAFAATSNATPADPDLVRDRFSLPVGHLSSARRSRLEEPRAAEDTRSGLALMNALPPAGSNRRNSSVFHGFGDFPHVINTTFAARPVAEALRKQILRRRGGATADGS
jgi:hypothetical protein